MDFNITDRVRVTHEVWYFRIAGVSAAAQGVWSAPSAAFVGALPSCYIRFLVLTKSLTRQTADEPESYRLPPGPTFQGYSGDEFGTIMVTWLPPQQISSRIASYEFATRSAAAAAR